MSVDFTQYTDSPYPSLSRVYGSEFDTVSRIYNVLSEQSLRAYREWVGTNGFKHPVRKHRLAKRMDVLHVLTREYNDKMDRIQSDHDRIVRDHCVNDNTARYVRTALGKIAERKASMRNPNS